jgi:glycine dehydrogenase
MSDFVGRHIGPSDDEQRTMLDTLGYASLDALVDAAAPAIIRDDAVLALDGCSETDALERVRAHASRNEVYTSLIGLGYHDTITPPVILRNVLENPAWYTAYTPYQPEISQGRLEALLNFQTMVGDLTGMELANASLLDEATAAAEAMAMLHRLNGKAGSADAAKPGTAQRGRQNDSNVFVVDPDTHPQTIDVVRVRAEPLGIEVVLGDAVVDRCFGLLLSFPGSSGAVRDLRPVIERAHDAGALVAVAADLLSCALLVPPGEMGADVVVGTTQRFGVPLGFGGPHAAYLATRNDYRRTLPGRLVGVSVDSKGRTAFRLALQTREQHIRREKATSNICTAQVLLAVIAGMYGAYHGADGLRAIARRVHGLTAALADALRDAGVEVVHGAFFDTLTVRVPGRANAVHEAARARRINLREIDADTVGISLDQTTTPEVVAHVAASFGASLSDRAGTPSDALPGELVRSSEFMTHPAFTSHRSEHQMLRYLRRLADRDLALDRTMIPLGSCTMKLNATAEMEPVTWPEFGRIHPFAPVEQAAGYLELFDDLERWLAEITGYDAVSLQPNAGSQGEYAGLLAIRKYHDERGDDTRTVCLIPASAHGTNAASAAMAGMEVVVVACDEHGNVDIDDLKRKAHEHQDRLGALMVTYPSTHGVYEEQIREICAIVHEHGGQVYLDGANLNALVGVARPGKFGADVSHLNLHKTFCIPHGGGGPGVGPIGVRAHLAPYLPNHPLRAEAGPASGIGAISAAPWGSAGILPISWMYVTMMGGDGLRRATEVAILNANYLAAKLAPHYPVLYTGTNGLVAHECIVDLRPITKDTGVTVDDVAKRLIDYGFHAPTMSFPVAGTLMIEPTESEDLAELDRFVDAMVGIRREIERVAEGAWPGDDNPLINSPHTAEDVVSDEWSHAYSREVAAYPIATLRHTKYWSPVSRIDGAYGDRNVFCSCPPIDDYS